jgi:hypothetical protein
MPFTPWAGTSLRCLWPGLRLQETRNSANQFVPGVYHFPLPGAFRDPVFRPSRTCHVVFDREVFQRVRDEDLGTVRGQPIRPVLAGFGEPVTVWLFQSAMEARPGESAFCLRAGEDWPHGEGWLLVYGLRWQGQTRRLCAPDSLVGVFYTAAEVPRSLNVRELLRLLEQADDSRPAKTPDLQEAPELTPGRSLARQILRERLAGREPAAQTTAGLSLLMAARITG